MLLLAVRTDPGRPLEQAPEDVGGCDLASLVVDVLLDALCPQTAGIRFRRFFICF